MALCLSVKAAWADFKIYPAHDGIADILMLFGEITQADSENFAKALDALPDKNNILVGLKGDGGDARAGLEIADLVRRSGLATHVPDGATCASACAIIWIAGKSKGAGKFTHIGFHAAYSANTGQHSPTAMALTGTLLGYLNYSYDAVIWMTSAKSLSMNWLTPEIAA